MLFTDFYSHFILLDFVFEKTREKKKRLTWAVIMMPCNKLSAITQLSFFSSFTVHLNLIKSQDFMLSFEKLIKPLLKQQLDAANKMH